LSTQHSGGIAIIIIIIIIIITTINEMGWARSAYGETGELYAGFWCGNLRERDRLEDPGVDVRIILRWIFSLWELGTWSGLI